MTSTSHPSWLVRSIDNTLILVTLAEGLVLIGLERERVRESKLIRAAVVSRRQGEQYDVRKDPVKGSVLPRLTLTSIEGGRSQFPTAGHKGAVLIFIGGCVPCVADRLREWNDKVNPHIPVYVVTRSGAEEAIHFRRRYKINLPFFYEPIDDKQLKPFNLFWRPRVYIVDASSRLVLLQGQGDNTATMIKRTLATLPVKS